MMVSDDSAKRVRQGRCCLRIRSIGVGAALLLSSAGARAEPTAIEKADARTYMNEGRALRGQNRLEAALRSFKAADTIMHVPTTGLEVARTLEALGRLVEARSAARRVLTIPLSPADPVPFQEAVSAAAALHADLERRLPTVTFVLPAGSPEERPTVWVDGQPVPASDLGSPLRLDPGTHQIAAHLGQLDATQSIDLHEGDKQPIVLKMPGDTPAKTATTGRGGGFPWRTVGYVSFGTSAAALLVGTITGALALSTKHTAEEGCTDGQCPPATWDAIGRAHNYATISTVGFATFGGTLALGFTSLALMPPKEGGTSNGSMSIRPRVGLGYAEIEGTF